MVKVTKFDPSAFLDNEELIAEYLTAAWRKRVELAQSLRARAWVERAFTRQ
jgi:DNA-binding phage protein